MTLWNAPLTMRLTDALSASLSSEDLHSSDLLAAALLAATGTSGNTNA